MNSKYLISGLIFIASVIIAVVLVYPRYQSFMAAGRLVVDKQSELDAETALINEVHKIQSRYKKAESDLLRVSDLLPSFNKKSTVDLFVEMESIAAESGILISSINFKEDAMQSGSGYKTTNVELVALSSYGAFKKFATAIEKNQHLMDIIRFSITPTAGKKEQDEEQKQSDEQAATAESAPIRPEDQSFSFNVSINAYYQ